jgi:SAM-dependent methyltransferase
MSAGVYPYDRVPYRSTSVATADCRRIELIARLFGLAAAPCAHARVLELGCGTAANLIPLALQHPAARFIGCDLSQTALASAQHTIDRLGLTNVELRHSDICAVDEGWGAFDYIVCHDVFSWVPAPVRQSILGIANRNLAARGVLYISYDVLPGWQLRGIARDMMRHHAAGVADAREAVEQARAILAMGAAVQDRTPGPYAELLRDEYYKCSAIDDEQLYHLVFTDEHQPFYFHEFRRLIEDAGLQLLGDADVTRLVGPREPPAVRALFDGRPWLEQQQYLDFLTNCTSRGALVCHRDVAILSHPDESVVGDCWIGLATTGGDRTAAEPGMRGALSYLKERHPRFVAFPELAARNGTLPMRAFMEAFAAGMIDLALAPPPLASEISDHPTASPLVRLQAQDGSTVTNQRGEAVRVTDLTRHVLTLLDGAHTRGVLSDAVGRQIQSGIDMNVWIVRRGDEALDAGRVTDDILRQLHHHALLIA